MGMVLVAQLCPTLCNSMDCSPPGSMEFVHGILYPQILKDKPQTDWQVLWLLFLMLNVRVWPEKFISLGRVHGTTRKAWILLSNGHEFKFWPYHLTLCLSFTIWCLWGLQARILQSVAIPSSRGSFQPRDRIQDSCIAGRCLTIWTTIDVHVNHGQTHEKVLRLINSERNANYNLNEISFHILNICNYH